MKSEFFEDFGIPIAECEIEARLDDRGVPRLLFKSMGNPGASLDLATARQLRLMLVYAGETAHADELARHIATATIRAARITFAPKWGQTPLCHCPHARPIRRCGE